MLVDFVDVVLLLWVELGGGGDNQLHHRMCYVPNYFVFSSSSFFLF